MTRKYIVALAAALKAAREASNYRETQEAMLEMHSVCANNIADAIADLYPNFDAKRFLEDCGVS